MPSFISLLDFRLIMLFFMFPARAPSCTGKIHNSKDLVISKHLTKSNDHNSRQRECEARYLVDSCVANYALYEEHPAD